MAENVVEKMEKNSADPFKRVKTLMAMGDKILLSRHKVNFYQQALDCLKKTEPEEGTENTENGENEEISAERDSLETALKRRLNHAKAGMSIEIYGQACTMVKFAHTPEEFGSAELRFHECEECMKANQVDESLLDENVREKYEEAKQAPAQAALCRKQSSAHFHKNRAKTLGIIAAAALIGAGVFFGIQTSTYHMTMGKVQMALGLKDEASENFKKAYDRHPGDKTYSLYVRALYEQGKDSYDKGEYADAADQLNIPGMENYEDAAALCTTAEICILEEAEAGDKVTFAGGKWYVLEQDGDKVFLLKFEGNGPLPYQDQPGGSSFWADSSLRAFLNGEYIETTFNENEKKCLIETQVENEDNPTYGTEGGPATEDLVYILSASEYEQYYDLINDCGHNCWLRTPGAAEGSTVFVDPSQVIMDYGYASDADDFCYKQVIWVDLTADIE